MVMKVGNINPILFRKSQNVTKPEEKQVRHQQIKELNNITPDFAVQVPQKYQLIGVEELSNGLKIYSYKLANGHKVSIVVCKRHILYKDFTDNTDTWLFNCFINRQVIEVTYNTLANFTEALMSGTA